MDMGKLEEAVRKAVQGDTMQPLLASLTSAGEALPAEFTRAALTLEARPRKPGSGKSLLDAEAKGWW